jgi:hypothetical protein
MLGVMGRLGGLLSRTKSVLLGTASEAKWMNAAILGSSLFMSLMENGKCCHFI